MTGEEYAMGQPTDNYAGYLLTDAEIVELDTMGLDDALTDAESMRDWTSNDGWRDRLDDTAQRIRAELKRRGWPWA